MGKKKSVKKEPKLVVKKPKGVTKNKVKESAFLNIFPFSFSFFVHSREKMDTNWTTNFDAQKVPT